DAAVGRVGGRVMAALETAARRIRAFHEHARRTSWLDHTPSGGALGQLIRPLDRVGIYAPGGRSPYPSSVLMAAVPARVAEVSEVVLASPPGGPNGEVSDVLLAAARVAKVDSVYRVGGAHAIAALAYGTESLPRVDKIVGPGNLFVVLAKRMVFGQVGIEALPGPTECLVVADDSANPAWVAADLLAQAEHDPLACSILITPDHDRPQPVNAEAIGDYAAGPSHIMPTGGTARFSSPVNVDDFVKIISVFGLSPDDLREAGPPAVVLARAESLEAHARAVECRLWALHDQPST